MRSSGNGGLEPRQVTGAPPHPQCDSEVAAAQGQPGMCDEWVFEAPWGLVNSQMFYMRQLPQELPINKTTCLTRCRKHHVHLLCKNAARYSSGEAPR